MALYNQVYGKYTAGTGSWLDNATYEKGKKNIYDAKVLEYFKSIISIDLSRINLLNKINNLEIMDVGTGRQAISFYELGAKSVDHYDISLTNVKNLKKYVKKNKLPIRSFHSDICNTNFNNKKKYNFIYLQGIIQHVSNPFAAITNLSNACKKEGILWFYNYQVGAINHIYIEAFRYILANKIDYRTLTNILFTSGFNSKAVDSILDNYGCNYRHLIKNSAYHKHLANCGFSKFYSKDEIDQSNGIDLRVTTNACIAGYKKKSSELNNIIPPKIKHVNHFDPKNYILSQQSFIKEFNLLNSKILCNLKGKKLSNYDLISICMPLFRGYLLNKNIQPFQESKQNIINSFKSCLFLLKNRRNL